MVLSYYGHDIDEATLRDCCHTTNAGTRADDVASCAKHHGVDADHIRSSNSNALHKWLGTGIFPIVLLNMFPIDLIWRMHAVVIIAIDSRSVHLLDPAQGRRVASVGAFEQAWQMNLNRAIVVTEADSADGE